MTTIEPIEPLEPIEPIADGVERPLDPRALALERAVGRIVAAAVALPLLGAPVLAFAWDAVPRWLALLVALAWLAAALALAWWAERWPEVAHRHVAYRIDGRGIEIRRGVFWRAAIAVPRTRVQHTDVSQGPLERRYGLGTLALYTAGTDHARVDLRGLDHETALRIRDHLLGGEGGDAV